LRSPSLFILPLLLAGAKAATLDIHYAPAENLEAIDVDLINQAGLSIDMAAYVLSDAAVIEALCDAADRGVAVRLYLDAGEYPAQAQALGGLFARVGVDARVKTGASADHIRDGRLSEKAQNLQDTFLNHVRKSKTSVTIFLVNGVKLQGFVTWFDNFCVLLRRDGHSQLVYKHAISTIMPASPIQMFEAVEEGAADQSLRAKSDI
jgi:host factor-I protein